MRWPLGCRKRHARTCHRIRPFCPFHRLVKHAHPGRCLRGLGRGGHAIDRVAGCLVTGYVHSLAVARVAERGGYLYRFLAYGLIHQTRCLQLDRGAGRDVVEAAAGRCSKRGGRGRRADLEFGGHLPDVHLVCARGPVAKLVCREHRRRHLRYASLADHYFDLRRLREHVAYREIIAIVFNRRRSAILAARPVKLVYNGLYDAAG